MNTKIQKSNIKVSEHEFLWSTFVKTSVDAFDDDRSDLNRIRNDEEKNGNGFGISGSVETGTFFSEKRRCDLGRFFQETEAS